MSRKRNSRPQPRKPAYKFKYKQKRDPFEIEYAVDELIPLPIEEWDYPGVLIPANPNTPCYVTTLRALGFIPYDKRGSNSDITARRYREHAVTDWASTYTTVLGGKFGDDIYKLVVDDFAVRGTLEYNARATRICAIDDGPNDRCGYDVCGDAFVYVHNRYRNDPATPHERMLTPADVEALARDGRTAVRSSVTESAAESGPKSGPCKSICA